MLPNPPKWANWFLRKTCTPKFLDELQGDLLELFYRELEELGAQRARRQFAVRALLSPRWYRLPHLSQFTPTVMYKTHFKVAMRHARRHRSTTFIQALGLTLGFTAILFIALFIKNESSYDHMHVHNDQLHRVLRVNPLTGEREQATSSQHGARLKEEFPFITVTRFGNDPVKMGEVRPILVDDFYWADSTFFELFSFEFLHGHPATCLDQVNSLVITESLSQQLFATDASVGRTLPVKIYDGDQELLMEVKAVVKDPPQHTHIRFQALGAMANAEDLYVNLVPQWGFSWLRTYIKVPAGRLAEIEASIPQFIRKHVSNDPPPSFGIGFQRFNDVYLHSQDINRNPYRGNIRYLQIFGAVGILILLISLMNYVNLSTARVVTRAKEVGIRKTLGSPQGSIIAQFIAESILFIFVSGLLALAVVSIALPSINRLLDLELTLRILQWGDALLFLLTLLLIGLLTGIIPALALARLPLFSEQQIATTLRPGQWSWTRKLFVGAQYLISMSLLAGTIVIYKQYLHLKNSDLGFNSEQLLHIAVDDRQLQGRLTVLKERIAQLPGVAQVAATGEDLPSALNNTWSFDWNGAPEDQSEAVAVVGVDQDYFAVMDLPFLSGRNFSQGFDVDSARTVILNEEAARLMGRADVVGETVTIGMRERKVQGVIKNHHFTSLHANISPMAYFIFPPGHRVSPDNLLIRLQTNKLSPLLIQLEGIWHEFSTDPFEHNFVDEAFAAAYKAEQRFSSLISGFTLVAVIISIVGLFGLINFVVELKLKEISIRRVLGANQLHLIHLLGRDFLLVFTGALALALPLSYYLIQLWLDNYSYQIDLNLLTLVPAVLACLIISLLIIYYHVQRSTKIDPSLVLAGE
ncbi:MAG: ABC transporter permease [Bacteroidota bacterium]